MDSNNTNEVAEEQTNETEELDPTEGKQSIAVKPLSSIPLRKQPEQLCNCPLHCDTKFNKEWKEKIYKQFGELSDHATQNQYIQRHIKIKSIAKRLWEDEIIDKKIQRRVTCKYLIPITGSVIESYSFAKTLDYDTVKKALDTKSLENITKQSMSAAIQNNDTKTECKNDITTETESNTAMDTEMSNNALESSNCDTSMETLDNTCNTTMAANDDTFNTTIGTNNNTFNTTVGTNNHTFNTTMETSDTFNAAMEMKNENTPFDATTELKNESATLNATTEMNDGITINANTETKNEDTLLENAQTPVIVNGFSEENEERNTSNTPFENHVFSKENISDVSSPMSINDNDSVKTTDETSSSELNGSAGSTDMKYVEVCQKAFMNMYGITEKRIRWQREKLILKSRYLAEKKKKELEEMERTLLLARNLGAGCQPLFALLERSNCKQLSEQLLVAIEDDVAMVNNFFHNQLWKPEDIMNKSVYFSSLDTCENEYE